ncbi:MAG: efflux RND transporter periplasmic adaptor subunit, partial [Acidobacteriota bacterium]
AHQHGATAPATGRDESPMPVTPGTASAGEALKSLAIGLADAAAALAADELTGYQRQLPALRSALARYFAADAHAEHGPLGKFKDALLESADLKSAREEFAPLSTAVAGLARAGHLHHSEGLHIFQCEMAPGGTGRWLQREAGVKNPFLGSAMSTCGTEIEDPTAPGAGGMAAMLPPGHPPIDGGSISDYLLAQATPNAAGKPGADDACGSCGMSAADMAAGQPCEHDAK